jgi:acyl-CoA thioesterase-1
MPRWWSRIALMMWFLVALSGCGERPGSADVPPPPAGKDTPAPARATILMIGTSLTAGYGLDTDQAWPALVQLKIDSAGLPFRVVNAGVSGETSAGARRRLGWLLQQDLPRVVVLETGANDGLRGLSLDSLEANLDAILAELGALTPPPKVFVAGMEALPNLGREYTNDFRALFPRAARAYGAEYLPFLLDGVAGNARFNQGDGIHPNAEGSRVIAERVWREIEPVLRVH